MTFKSVLVRIGLAMLGIVAPLLALADDIHMLSGLKKPPYIVQEQVSGIELDIIKAAFATQNINVNFIHMPLGRILNGYTSMKAEGVTLAPAEFQENNIVLSTPYISYQNVVVSLKESELLVEELAALQGKRVAAFQLASSLLGDEYRESIAACKHYVEVADQEKQIRLLFEQKVDALVIDKNIFYYYWHNQTDGIFNKDVQLSHIFPERRYRAGFRNQQLADVFNSGLSQIIATGQYQNIIEHYRG